MGFTKYIILSKLAGIRNIWNVVNRGAKLKDSLIISLLGGLIGTMAMDISNLLLWRTNKTDMLYGHLSGSIIMRGVRTNRAENFALGQILHMVTGAALGIPIYQILKRTGKDHHIIKGAFAGTMSWGILYNFGQRAKLFSSKPHMTKSHYNALWHNILYGITTAQAVVSLSDSSLLTQKVQIAQDQNTFQDQLDTSWANANISDQNTSDYSNPVIQH